MFLITYSTLTSSILHKTHVISAIFRHQQPPLPHHYVQFAAEHHNLYFKDALKNAVDVGGGVARGES